MKLAFVFDTCFSKYEDKYYSTNLTQELWNQRYLKYFDEIVVIGRYEEEKTDPEGKMVRSDNEHVKFKCIKNKSLIKRMIGFISEEKFILNSIVDCDAVICRGWWGTYGCRKLKKIHMVEAIVCTWDVFWNHSMFGKFVALPEFLLQKYAIKHSQFVIYVTEKFLQSRYPSKGITAGISDVYLEEANFDQIIKKRIDKIRSRQDKIMVIGTAAAVNVRYKGQEKIIRALGYLKRLGYTNYEYQLAGGGDTSYLAEVAEKENVLMQVKFLGPIPHDKMFNWYDSIDIYIQPSMVEGLPRAVVEAMSRGLPCLGTNVGGIPELLSEECIFTKKSSISIIANMIKELDEEKMINMAMRNANESKRFDNNILNSKRDKFMRCFVCKVKENNE